MLARSLYKTCHSLNQRRKDFPQPLGWEEQKSAARRFFVDQINMTMISRVNFSGFFLPKHVSPVGNSDGYYVYSPTKPIVPVTQQ